MSRHKSNPEDFRVGCTLQFVNEYSRDVAKQYGVDPNLNYLMCGTSFLDKDEIDPYCIQICHLDGSEVKKHARNAPGVPYQRGLGRENVWHIDHFKVIAYKEIAEITIEL